MKINKITTGYVIQVFDTDSKQYISQEFAAGNPVEYESQTGEIVDPVENGMQDADGTEPYLPFNMIQPNSVESCRESIQEDLMAFFDGLPDEAQYRACQIVVDNFEKFF